IADIRPAERTTAAGRFVTVPGHDTKGHRVVWIDYAAGLSMHTVVTDVPAERRLQRMASADPAEHRISYGCVNLPARFFEDVAAPAFAKGRGVIYILPDTRRLEDVFPGLAGSTVARRPAAALLARATDR
ncbi:MAG TPA: hypothetical protein VFF72_08625, partial [Caldimonas sp.]|nr:hypothetical protein [Caldimonas sp.]